MLKTSKPIPEKLDILNDIGGVTIRRKWFTPMVLGLVIFAIAWDSFLFFWYSTALTPGSKAPWIMIVFPVGHVAVGIGITYFCICSLFNKTDISITNSTIIVRSHPLPWRGNLELYSSEILSFSTRSKFQQNNRGGLTYEVTYVDQNNRLKTLLRGLPEFEQAEFIAAELAARTNKEYIISNNPF